MPITGSMTSYFLIGGSAGAMALPWVIGQFFEPLGPPVVMSLIGASVVLAVILFAGILLYSRRFAMLAEE